MFLTTNMHSVFKVQGGGCWSGRGSRADWMAGWSVVVFLWFSLSLFSLSTTEADEWGGEWWCLFLSSAGEGSERVGTTIQPTTTTRLPQSPAHPVQVIQKPRTESMMCGR